MINVFEAYEDAINNDMGDWIKISVLSGLVFLSYFFYSNSQTELFYYVGGTTVYLLLVLMLCVINNVRNGQNYVLPRFLSWQYIIMMFWALISVVPFVVLMVWLGFKILSLEVLSLFPELFPVCQWIVWLIIAGISFLVVMIFGRTGNPLSVFDFKSILNHSVDVLPHLFFTFIAMAIANGLILGIIGYVFWVFLSLQHLAFVAICSFALVINVVALGNCLAQIEYEVIPREEKEHII